MDREMALLEQWQSIAYNEKTDKNELQKFWQRYFLLEKGVYEKLLSNPDEVVEGTVKELAEKYELDIMAMTGFLDGINESLLTPNPIEEMEEDTQVSRAFDKEKLYKNMVDARADWLYDLPQWDDIFDEATKKRLYLEQKAAGTVRREGKKIGRNDPCPCGSGKKYKKCCGR
jgi:Predicted metal-binding protein related to the C-terminal domain of SecA